MPVAGARKAECDGSEYARRAMAKTENDSTWKAKEVLPSSDVRPIWPSVVSYDGTVGFVLTLR